jgi:hypothetical protein
MPVHMTVITTKYNAGANVRNGLPTYKIQVPLETKKVIGMHVASGVRSNVQLDWRSQLALLGT